jgi:hypothetical protein
MLIFIMKVNDKEVIKELMEWTGIVITSSVLKRLINNNLEILPHLSNNGIDSTTGRELLMDAMVEDLDMGLSVWPTYYEGKKIGKEFEKKLEKKVKSKPGYKFCNYIEIL